jgi:thiol-disulfide isomerase/thioredoxin
MAQDHRFWRKLGRLALTLVVVVVGTFIGVYVAVGMRAKEAGAAKPLYVPAGQLTPLSEDQQFARKLGEDFPNETFLTEDDSTGTFEMFFDGTPTILLFWSPGCEPCIDQAKMWKKYVEPNLRNDVKQVVCMSTVDRPRVDEWRSLLAHKTVVFVDWERFRDTYNMVVKPTVFVVDGHGQIAIIMYQHSVLLPQEFLSLLKE